jgi:phosphoenolpyruvate carboxykinase (diphosphate)
VLGQGATTPAGYPDRVRSGSSERLMPTQPDSASTVLHRYLNLRLAALGQPVNRFTAEHHLLEVTGPLLRSYADRSRLLTDYLCPSDNRIQSFLDEYLADVCADGVPRLPSSTLLLDSPGMARILSLPPSMNSFKSAYLESYRVAQGVLHNPVVDRRTTQGVFHIAEGGFPVPADKYAVPRQAFAALLHAALHPPQDVMVLPYTADQPDQARVLVSLLLRPLVCPAIGPEPSKTMEIRFFAPGNLVSNLDFVETIFGNAGDPDLPEADAALDPTGWTGHTGCVILAPHIQGMKKVALGLPHASKATDRQKRDGMCWEKDDEIYNSGLAFKITARDHRGVIVTLIADNYYGYCKKEVKTQISYSANLYGIAEEEHAGGAIAFPAYVLGRDYVAHQTRSLKKTTFEEAMRILGGMVDRKSEGYAVDRLYPNIIYVSDRAEFRLNEGCVRWDDGSGPHQLPLRPDETYVVPSGARLRVEKHAAGNFWRLVGTRPRGTFCHKPCTVSGGGKSEISKSLVNTLLAGPVYVNDFQHDMDRVEDILRRDFSSIYKNRPPDDRTRRPILSPDRTLGSVIQLLTPSPEYLDTYNAWVNEIPAAIRQLVFTVKRHHRPEWGGQWRQHFSVDRVNGRPGHELKFQDQKLISNYLRVGYETDGSWRIFKLRPDFHPSDKVQTEDDISASAVIPRENLKGLDPEFDNASVKLVVNCERYLFQRPDDAIIRGADQQAEADLASDGTFLSNYQPLTADQVRRMTEHLVEFDQFTQAMKDRLLGFLKQQDGSQAESFVACSAQPRVVNGKPSKNPRYLQKRPDLVNPRDVYLAEIAARLEREVPEGTPVPFPVNSVLVGRRNSLPDPSIQLPPLAVYGPIHYQELPELFMEFITSLTGKSPATTGFGFEGALTKGPFNALWTVVDLNNALVSFLLTGYAGFTTSAGVVGPKIRVDHDVSLLIPEIWCRMRVPERDPKALIQNGFLEKVEDLDVRGRKVLASRLGYRITSLFVDRYFGRIFETPSMVFPEHMLRPELQDKFMFVEGVDAIVEAQRTAALNYFEDGSVEAACPPLRALLHIMAYGNYCGKGIDAPEIRSMFTRELLLTSAWYRERLETRQQREIALWSRHAKALKDFQASGRELRSGDSLETRLAQAQEGLNRVSSKCRIDDLVGTIGTDPFHHQMPKSGQAISLDEEHSHACAVGDGRPHEMVLGDQGQFGG